MMQTANIYDAEEKSGRNPPVDILAQNLRGDNIMRQSAGDRSCCVDYDRVTFETLADINRALSSISMLLESIDIKLGIMLHPNSTLSEPRVINRR